MKKLLFLSGILMSASAVAGAPSSSRSDANADPNQTICRSIPDTSSRVSRTRVCMTRQQWEERRQEARGNVERSQVNRRNDGE